MSRRISRVPRPLWRTCGRQLLEWLERDHRPDAVAGLALVDWGRRFLPAHFARPPSRLHRWLGAQLDQLPRQRGSQLNVIGPRGSAKSTLATLAWALRLAVTGLEPYVWIVSDTRAQAAAHLDNLRAELLDNRLLARAYPQAVGRGPVWRATSLVLNNGVALEAFGTGQRIRGRRRQAHRPTLIIADDLQNDRHMLSAHAREESRQWFHGTLLQAGRPRTNVVNLATALHRDALALSLARSPGWTSRLFRAIERWPDRTELWQTWETIYSDVERPDAAAAARAFYEAHRPAMEAGAELLWPEEEDLYTLMRLRLESGRTAFEREKQGNPLDPERCEWPAEYLGPAIWFDEWPAELRIKTMALDPSKGRDARHGDYSALVMLGIDSAGTVFVEADLARRPTPQMVADGVAWYLRFQPAALGIEANQFQELLGHEFEAAFARAGVWDAAPWMMENRVPKAVRIRRLGPLLATGRLRFKTKSPGTALLVTQLADFPQGDHDDGPDATEMALRLATEMEAQ